LRVCPSTRIFGGTILVDKILLIGWDGASWNYINPLLEEGKLPNLSYLIKSGTFSTLQSTNPPYTNIAWPSLVTGRKPDKTGVFDGSRSEPGSYQSIPTNLTGFRGIPIWAWLERFGFRSGVLNVPMTFPAKALDGYLVSGFDSPHNSTKAVYPRDLLTKWASEGHPYRILSEEIELMNSQNPQHQRGNLDEFVTRWVELTLEQGNFVTWLWNEHPADFLFTVFSGTDSINHRTNERGKINRVYEAADEALGYILDLVGQNTLVCVVSDHGSIPAERYISIYRSLYDGGWLHFKPIVAKRYIRRLPFVGNGLQKVWSLFPDLIRNMISIPFLKIEPRLAVDYNNINWLSTSCYSRSSMGPLYINLAGDKPQGCVSQGDYNFIREEIKDSLLKLNDESGDPIFRTIYRGEEIYPNSKPQDDPPDLLAEPFKWSDHMITGFPSDPLVRPISEKIEYGTHTPEGIFIISGPGVAENEQLDSIHIVDVFPNLLAAWELPIPENVDGSIHPTLFTKKLNITFETEKHFESEGIDVTDSSHAEEIRDRLRSLGYFD